MVILKQVPDGSFFPVIKGMAYAAMYSTLRQLLPPQDMIFAEEQKAQNRIHWKHAQPGWVAVTEADPALSSMAMDQFRATMERIRTALAKHPATASRIEQILSFPDDSYIFCRVNEANQVEVALAGWGYKLRTVGPVDYNVDVHLRHEQPVSFSFVDNGAVAVNRPFSLSMPSLKAPIRKDTGATGIFSIGTHVQEGAEYTITDEVTAKTFELQVVKGKIQYDFDVTVPKPEPEPEPPVVVVPPVEEPPVVADPPVAEPPVVEQPPVVEPPVEPVITVRAEDEQHRPLAGTLTFTQEGSDDLVLTLDAKGAVQFPADRYAAGSTLTASVATTDNRQYPSVPFQLEAGETEYVLTYGQAQGSKLWQEVLAVIGMLLLAGLFFYLFTILVPILSAL